MSIIPKSWLAFELNVLRRLKFESIALPFSGEPNLGAYLKRSNVRVLANDFLPSLYAKSLAQIQNNGERLSEAEVEQWQRLLGASASGDFLHDWDWAQVAAFDQLHREQRHETSAVQRPTRGQLGAAPLGDRREPVHAGGGDVAR